MLEQLKGSTPDVVADAQGRLDELMNIIDRDGAKYIREYAEHMVRGGTRNRTPPRPSSLPAGVAVAIREIVQDAVYAVRR